MKFVDSGLSVRDEYSKTLNVNRPTAKLGGRDSFKKLDGVQIF